MNLKQKIKQKVRYSLTKISPKVNTEICYWLHYKKMPDLKNPKTLNEKSCWLKIYDYNCNPEVKRLADKYRVREFLKERNCEEILIDLIAVYDSPKDIEWDKLPNKFAMKLNVGSQSNLICKDKSTLDMDKAKKEVNRWFTKENLESFYLDSGEMQYKDVKPRIVVEELLEDKKLGQLVDYKFYCVNGKAEYLTVCYDRFSEEGVKFYIYDKNWKFFPQDNQKNPNIKRPEMIDKAFKYADKLSNGFPYVRVDLYIVNNKIYFGEMTFTGAGGFDTDIPMDIDIELGKKLKIEGI